jgi:ppGpp synthetase/RelA/SpoT-type nucleotidyltranferase
VADLQIMVGRLQKKVAKLQQQRDYYRQRCEHYREVLSMHPAIEFNHRTYTEQKAERERMRGLEQRVNEQAMLIKKLSREEQQ